MKKLSVNERAKRGIPSLAITNRKQSMDKHEGYDRNGRLWLRIENRSMEPEIMPGSYVCLKPLRKTAIMGLNGEVYAFVISRDDNEYLILGHVIKRQDGYIRVLQNNPKGTYNDLLENEIKEVYQIILNLKPVY